MGKFFHQIWMPENVKQSGIRHAGISFPIMLPNGIHITLRPAPKPLRIVKIPVAQIMHRANEIVPFITPRQLLNPWLAPGQPVALQARTHRNPPRSMRTRTRNPSKISRELGILHAPIIKRLRNLRRMIGNPILAQTHRDGALHKGFRLALGMTAERCMRMIISRHLL